MGVSSMCGCVLNDYDTQAVNKNLSLDFFLQS